MKNKGFLYYAHNNEKVNYLKLAICSALTGHYYVSDYSATLVTDSFTLESASDQERDLLEKYFDKVIEDQDHNTLFNRSQDRQVSDVYESHGKQPWYNHTRPSAFDLSPYQETVLLDVDVIFQEGHIAKVWGSDQSIMMAKNFIGALPNERFQRMRMMDAERVSDYTVPLYWATAVYFKKNTEAQTFFNLVSHIKENYSYYRRLYQFRETAYRNDHTFSVAAHIMNGYKNPPPEFSLPWKYAITTFFDVIYRVDHGSTKVLANTHQENSEWLLLNLKDISYHALNKLSLQDKFEQFVEAYDD